ncbi:YqaE/Pmp3 family membrane protein [Bacillus thuringiensis]|uniref:YqaE/Pmp3 family membrane protein n=1 Tax=Bacillus thuringiensis TaxID=1428 RepID=A0A9X6YC62_BACTU|nr:YqaE/Pmp3 family membrane protein [Bacillus thuringiensis]PEA91145.1 YqaE/Pmp3 family membrane protein [Bacillus thuringiensis]HDR7711199.1 YqaE/Pmp3 family membrane protein [Bacillus cereus]
MMYLLAVICPPLAVLLTGKPVQALLSLVLTMFFYFPGLIHAVFVVHEKKADNRLDKQINEYERIHNQNRD